MATIQRLVKKLFEAPSWVATREPNKLYQDGRVVGEVTGVVELRTGLIHFSELASTGDLDQTREFQYQRYVLRVQRYGVAIGTKSEAVLSDSGVKSRVLSAVLGDVDCVVVQ